MWIFFNDSYVSIVQKDAEPDTLLVRARVKGDLQALFGEDAKVFESDTADYRFRLFVKRDEVMRVVGERLLNLNYPNFKSSIAKTPEGQQRYGFYTRVWDVMFDWQQRYWPTSYGMYDWWNYRAAGKGGYDPLERDDNEEFYSSLQVDAVDDYYAARPSRRAPRITLADGVAATKRKNRLTRIAENLKLPKGK